MIWVILAQFTPVDGASLGNWLIVALAVLVGVDRVMAIVDRRKPTPPLHQQFAAREELREIKDSLVEMKADFEKWSSSHYKARRRMHRKINSITTAMAYLAGSIESDQPRTAQKLRDLIHEPDHDEEGEGDEE